MIVNKHFIAESKCFVDTYYRMDMTFEKLDFRQILRHIGTINNEWIVSNILFSNLTGRIENADKPISINDRMLYVINT